MRARPSWFGLLGILTLASLPASAPAQPVGAEFQINTYTIGKQETCSRGDATLVAADASGNIVVVWDGVAAPGDLFYGISGQRYDSEGRSLGSEFRVNSFTTGKQRFPSVAGAADGNFVVVWQGVSQNHKAVFGQRYNSRGEAQGGEFTVGELGYFSSGHIGPSVASDASGNFLVVWGKTDLHGRRYDSGGEAQEDRFRVNSFTPGTQRCGAVAATDTNQFVVVWESSGQDGSSSGIFGRRFTDHDATFRDQARP